MPERKDESFGRGQRIQKRSDFQRTYSSGRKIVGRFFVVFVLARTAGGVRLGITVTRKSGKACVRNRMRRVVREIFRKSVHHQASAAAKPGMDIVVNLRPGAVDQDFRILEEDLLRIGQKVARN